MRRKLVRGPSLKDEVGVNDRARVRIYRGGGPSGGGGPGRGAPPIRRESNVSVTLREEPNGRIVERRDTHNIFLNYGREWLSELVSLDSGDAVFRNDRIRYMAFGLGGTRQLLNVSTVQSLFPAWSTFTTPAQEDTDPTITGLEYPIEVTASDYYDDVKQPATFPQAGIVRFTAVAGYLEISYPGGPTSVPLSEIGLFTNAVSDQSVAPEPAPPARYMVAYNTFDTLSKTSSYVLQIDWELRFS